MQLGIATHRFGYKAGHQLASVNVLFRKAVNPVEIEFQSSYYVAVAVNGHCQEGKDPSLTAKFRVEQKFRIDILAANYLPGAHASHTNRGVQRSLTPDG